MRARTKEAEGRASGASLSCAAPARRMVSGSIGLPCRASAATSALTVYGSQFDHMPSVPFTQLRRNGTVFVLKKSLSI